MMIIRTRMIIPVFILLWATAASAALDLQQLDGVLEAAGDKLQQIQQRIKKLEEQTGQAAEQVRQAEASQDPEEGFLARTLEQDRLRRARQKHHRLSQELKKERMTLTWAIQRISKRVAEREQEFEKQLKSLSRNIQNEQNPTRRKALEKEKQQLEDFRRKFQEKVDAFFTPYADLLNTPLDFFPPHPPERREPGRRGDGRGPMPGGEHRMPLMHARWKFQEMQDRIQRLESEVKQLRRRLDQLENTPDSSSGKDSSKNQDSSF